MKLPLCVLAAFCMLISSCQKEGPLGFKTGQEYKYRGGSTSYEVIDVGEDWVEFERTSESGKKIMRVHESTL
nr:hypothetical protein [bacterium]